MKRQRVPRRRIVALTGFMGTGKTSVGKRLAERLGWPFVDTDSMIEAREGRTVAEIFAAEGEAYFRAREREAIAEAASMPQAVVATGGGAILDDRNFAALERAGLLVCLVASAEVILARTGGGGRPLLEVEDRQRRVRELLAQRSTAYARVAHAIDTSNLDVEQVVERVLELLSGDDTPGRNG